MAALQPVLLEIILETRQSTPNVGAALCTELSEEESEVSEVSEEESDVNDGTEDDQE